MGIPWRAAAIFAIGAIAGAVAGGGAVLLKESRPARVAQSPSPAPAPTAPRVAAAPAQAQATRSGAPCPQEPLVTAASPDDGQFKLIDSIADKRAGDVSALIVIGKEAAASSRPHDAEVAFMMACRIATQLHADAVTVADTQYELGWHYGNLARDSSGARHDALSQRARALYGDALRVYTARLGAGHEKSTFAANGLAALQQPVAPVAVTQPPKLAAPEGSSNDTRIAGAAAAPRARAPKPQLARVKPSFDCSRAHSTPERLICGDPQLAQLDRELGRLYATAKARAPDPQDFRRRSDAEWKRREAQCRDRQCLLAWYAQRRAQLLAEIDAQDGAGTRRNVATRSAAGG